MDNFQFQRFLRALTARTQGESAMNAKKYSLRNGIKSGVADSDPHLIANFAQAFATLAVKNYAKKMAAAEVCSCPNG